MNPSFGQLLKDSLGSRPVKDLIQELQAVEIDVSPQAVHGWLGNQYLPAVDRLPALCRIFARWSGSGDPDLARRVYTACGVPLPEDLFPVSAQSARAA